MVNIGTDWDELLKDEFQKEYYKQLRSFLVQEYRQGVVYPDINDVFNALRYTSHNDVKVVIVGQDPYINPGEAHGLAFSVKPTAKIPPSLTNIFKELESDLGCFIPNNGNLISWAQQGVLLLNTVLTVREGKSKSHAGKGWEQFTDTILELIDKRERPVVFMLWGQHAQQKMLVVKERRHLTLLAAHPSPLAGGRFFGCKHFSTANKFLLDNEITPIDWQIQNVNIYEEQS